MLTRHLIDVRDSWVFVRTKTRRYAWFYTGYAMGNLLLTAASLHQLSVLALNISLYLIVLPLVLGTVVITYKKIRRFRDRSVLAPSIYHRVAYLSVFFLAGVCAEAGFFAGCALNSYFGR